MDVFVYAADRQSLFQRTYTGRGWTFHQDSAWPYHVPMAAAYSTL